MNRSSILGALLSVALVGCGGGGGGSGGGFPGTASPATTTPKPTTAPPTTATVTTARPTPPKPAPTPAPTPAPAPPVTKLYVSAWLPHYYATTGGVTVKDVIGKALDEVDMFAYSLKTDGGVNVLAGARNASLIAATHNNQKKINMCVTGHSSADVVPFPAKRAVFVKACVDECVNYDLDGVDLDFENLRMQDGPDFNKLCMELAAALHAKKKELTITVIAKTAPTSTWGAKHALDYKTLGKIADRFKIMTYAYSGTFSGPGPIGPCNWVEQVVAYAVSEGIPKAKILLGIPFYGYDWPSNGTAIKSVTSPAARALAVNAIGGVIFDTKAGEAHFQYRDSAGVMHTVWFQNAKSIEAKARLAKKLGIAGVCCWSIGQDAKDFWTTFEAEKK